MGLNDETRERLAEGVEARTAAAAEALLSGGDTAAAKAHLEWAETAKGLLASGGRPSALHPFYRSALIGVACIALVLLAWSLPMWGNGVRLELKVSGLALALHDAWDLGEGGALPSKRLNAPGGLAKLYAPSLGDTGASPRGFSLEGDGLRLMKLEFPLDSALELEGDGGELRLFLRRGTAKGAAAIRSGALNAYSPGQSDSQVTLEPPPGMANIEETVTFESGPMAGQGAPFALYLETGEAWSFSGLRVGGLAFRRERAPGTNQWRSAVLEGKGELLDVGRSFELREREWLVLEDLDGVLDLKRDGEGIKLLFQGTADRVKAGPKDLERDLTPSLLEYFAQTKEAALLWGALLFLVGLAWKLRALW